MAESDANSACNRGRSGSEQQAAHQRNPGYSLTFRITCRRKRAKAAVAGQVHAVVGRRAAHRPYENYCQSDQLQEPTFARSGVGAHGAAAEVLLQHDVAPLSRDDPNAMIWLPAMRPALMNCSSGIVS